MTVKVDSPDVAEPEVVALLRSREARSLDARVRIAQDSADGGFVEYWLEAGEVRRCEVGSGEDVPPVLSALLEGMRSEFGGRVAQLMSAVDRSGPDLDSVELALRDGVHAGGAAGLKALLEELDDRLPTPECGKCGGRMERRERREKTFTCRLGRVRVRRIHVYCRACGNGHHPLDRHLGIEGGNATPGAETVIADIVKDDSYEQTSRKLGNTAGIEMSSSAIHRQVRRNSDLLERFEREVVVPGTAPSRRNHLTIDGTGIPMRREELKGIAGKQEDGTARTREVKVISIYTADKRDPRTGVPRKDPGSGVHSACIDSAAAGTGSSRNTEFGRRMEREVIRSGLFEAEELVVISDGASWIANACTDLFAGRPFTAILDFFHVSEYLSDALKAVCPDRAECERRFEADKERLRNNGVAAVVGDLRPHADRHAPVERCVRYMEANVGRMQCGTYRKRGMHIGSGVIESTCRQMVGRRLKAAGNHWTVKGANAMLALKSCVENNRLVDFLIWRAEQSVVA